MKTLLVSDANVLIDIEKGELTKVLFSLSCLIAVPDVLFEEELKARHSHLPDLGLQVMILQSEYVGMVVSFSQKYRKPSRNDLFALCLAMQEQAILITGDKPLRNAAINEKVPVIGTIGLVSKIVEEGIISNNEAEVAFEKMIKSGSRLPTVLIQAELDKLQNRK